ncbi:RNase adapter RapZ [Lysobacter niabensis]|uniref:RNase adapter RapZ n=1 Tax=Agrilutibacter niabensis TaxID=380628 RepID=UPI0036121B25
MKRTPLPHATATSNVTTTPPPTLIIVSGMSGSGKSVALNTFEDLDYYCVDNLPAELLPQFVQTVTNENSAPEKLAVGIDVRNRRDLTNLPEWLSAVGALGLDPRLVFFDASDEVLLKRYADTRRRHPLSSLGLSLVDAIALERQVLRPLRQIADAVVDTSDMNVHKLRRHVITEFGIGGDTTVSLLFESFAYRRGVPSDADFVLDARALPNPHWDATLRPLSGRDAGVRDYLDADPDVALFVQQISVFLDTWLPKLKSEGTRSYVTIAFGCTGGRHRSVYLAERLARHARQQGWEEVAVHHRELD